MDRYVALIETEKTDTREVYGVVFPDIPGTVTVGDTYVEALQNAQAALRASADAFEDSGEAMPAPRSAAEVFSDGDTDWYDLGDKIVALIPLVPRENDRAVRVTLSISPHLLVAIDTDAKARKLTRSAYVAEATRRMMAEP